jgi:hypothetical protein
MASISVAEGLVVLPPSSPEELKVVARFPHGPR